MKVHVREDSSGVGAPSALGGGGGGSGLAALYPDLGAHYGEQHGLGSHNDPHTDLDQSTDNNPPDNDSDNECSSEIADMEYETRLQQEGGSGRTPPASNLSSGGIGEHKSPSPESPGPIPRRQATPPDDQSCSAMSLKESYHIGSNIKK